MLAITFLFFNPTGTTFRSIPNILLRKYFHVLAIVMFAPVIIVRPDLMSLSFGVAISALVLIELIKYGRVPPLSQPLSTYMDAFLDGRDSGIVTLTHIYLLVGCSIPVFLTFFYDSGERSTYLHPLSAFSGLLTIGVGDSMASYVGIKYGKTKWFSTSKSLEGTIGGIVSCFIAGAMLLLCVTNQTTTSIQLIRLLIGSSISGLLEASTNQIDNIVLPILFF
ncbi:hypothetical protein SAMD00019534_118640 [Acytostelium subglobosum LB1]|uniref:hypothetical protein n=1 Tax=Acytostelium subglobosum LB1 TaxID=1410327 RepID=UPI000644B724|nr:hypothetical protein SAMD00019534_118640 [Acytostelium subglobosum LB1]GAM28688.1 hypothetical protein SAMD00019534_118640 [Acytostelium subglobosum LB1]|eukprot:XP_012748466.1 hypothetical protein SAMD00019534_118640 [Acytostelium subglobosum LB1]